MNRLLASPLEGKTRNVTGERLKLCLPSSKRTAIQWDGKGTKSANSTQLGDSPEGHAAIQRDLDRSEEWAHRNLMQLSTEKHRVLSPGRESPLRPDTLGRPRKAAPRGDLADTRPASQQPPALRQAQRVEGAVLLPALHCTAAPAVPGPAPGSPVPERHGHTGAQHGAAKTTNVLEHLMH